MYTIPDSLDAQLAAFDSHFMVCGFMGCKRNLNLSWKIKKTNKKRGISFTFRLILLKEFPRVFWALLICHISECGIPFSF